MYQTKKTVVGNLLIGFLLVIGLLLALAGIGLVYLHAMNSTISRIVNDQMERSRLAAEMYIAARERSLQLYAILEEPDPFDRDALVPHFEELAGKFGGARAKLFSMQLSPVERQMLVEQGRYTSKGAALQEEVLDLVLSDHKEAAEHLLMTQAIPAQNLATQHLRRFLDQQTQNGHLAAEETNGKYRLARNLMLGSAAVATLLATLIAVVVIRRQAHLLDRLRDREREARAMLENIPVPVWLKDLRARIVWANDGLAKIAGLGRQEIEGKGEADIWGEAEGRKGDREDRKAIDSGRTTRGDRRLTSIGGHKGHYIIARTPIANENGVWKGVLCVAHDLTAMERMNDLLEATNQELQAQKTALDEHAIVSIADIDGNITYVNDKFCAISGYAREELLGQNHRIVNSGLHPPEYFAEMWHTIADGRIWRGEIRNKGKDGSFYWQDATIVPFLDPSGKPYQYIAIRTDISVLKRMEDSLLEINNDLQQWVDNRTEAVSKANQQLEADIVERNRSQALLQQQYQELEILHRKLQDAQAQLLQSEKLASIGQLAAGVAHEINNPIGYVQSNLGTLENYIRDLFRIIAAYEHAEQAVAASTGLCAEVAAIKQQLDLAYLREDIPVLMSESKEGITRVRKIVQDLKDFSRLDSTPDWQTADLHQGLDSTLNIVNNEIKYHADVVRDYGEIPEIECLPSQLNQVFMNLLVNAAHAIEGPRGTITVRTGREGDAVWVEVADTGKGIPEEIRARIFDPFFTTKPVGKGTGLGLSLAYGIIQKHNGRIEVDSEVGKGTTFRVVLPVKRRDSDGVDVAVLPSGAIA